jgi:hypothetical protein
MPKLRDEYIIKAEEASERDISLVSWRKLTYEYRGGRGKFRMRGKFAKGIIFLVIATFGYSYCLEARQL